MDGYRRIAIAVCVGRLDRLFIDVSCVYLAVPWELSGTYIGVPL